MTQIPWGRVAQVLFSIAVVLIAFVFFGLPLPAVIGLSAAGGFFVAAAVFGLVGKFGKKAVA
ncbi:MAG: hypothetical protein AABX89_03705 [Candidatus Thermoplasmatota archaeon]